MNRSFDITNYQFSSTDKLLLDANIWLYIYGPQGNPTDKRALTYSNALANAIKAKSLLFVDVLIISEFINRFAHIEYDIRYPNRSNRPEFKHYRNDKDFTPVARNIANMVRHILKLSTRLDSGFPNIDINSILAEFELGGCDFNDQIFVTTCKTVGIFLVTHDLDFKNKGVDILTANQGILHNS